MLDDFSCNPTGFWLHDDEYETNACALKAFFISFFLWFLTISSMFSTAFYLVDHTVVRLFSGDETQAISRFPFREYIFWNSFLYQPYMSQMREKSKMHADVWIDESVYFSLPLPVFTNSNELIQHFSTMDTSEILNYEHKAMNYVPISEWEVLDELIPAKWNDNNGWNNDEWEWLIISILQLDYWHLLLLDWLAIV